MLRKTLVAGLSLAWVLSLAGVAHAGPVYNWNWSAGDAGAVSNAGGTINWIQSEFDTNNNTLSWYVNFGSVPYRPWLRTEAFTLALNNGPNPKGHAGELAIFYFDTTKSSPILTAYGYNGRNDTTSHRDGSRDQAGDQTPDRLGSSLDSGANSWVHDLTFDTESNGSRTMGFSIDVTDILGHTPLYPETGPWHGTGYDSKIGVWMHSFAGMRTSYNDHYVNRWDRNKEGWLDLSNEDTDVTQPVPEPSTLALVGLGLVGSALVRRRRRSA